LWDRVVRQGVLCRIACLTVMYDTECLLRLLSFVSSMYFGRYRSVFSRLGRVDSLLRWLWNLVILFVTFNEKSHGRILLARLADRFRSPWKQTSEETMERVFLSSDFLIFLLDLLCLIIMYLKGTILLYESYLRILLVCFVGTAQSSSVVRVNGRTVIVLPLPVAWSLALEQFFHKLLTHAITILSFVLYSTMIPDL
jgi:multisubunit Na+/H+ antiporter MnhF subunit